VTLLCDIDQQFHMADPTDGSLPTGFWKRFMTREPFLKDFRTLGIEVDSD
jgi:hypothetical protein